MTLVQLHCMLGPLAQQIPQDILIQISIECDACTQLRSLSRVHSALLEL